MEKIAEYSHISIALNPFTSQTTITVKKEQNNTTIKITDVFGHEIKTINFSGKQLVIEKGEMENGIYLIQSVDQKKNVEIKKLVVH